MPYVSVLGLSRAGKVFCTSPYLRSVLETRVFFLTRTLSDKIDNQYLVRSIIVLMILCFPCGVIILFYFFHYTFKYALLSTNCVHSMTTWFRHGHGTIFFVVTLFYQFFRAKLYNLLVRLLFLYSVFVIYSGLYRL